MSELSVIKEPSAAIPEWISASFDAFGKDRKSVV